MNTTLAKAREIIPAKTRAIFELKNGESIQLSPAVHYLHFNLGLESLLTRVIKHQYNIAIQRQLFQLWKITRSKKDCIALSITDRYGEYLVLEYYPDSNKDLPELTFYMINRVLYIPEEIE